MRKKSPVPNRKFGNLILSDEGRFKPLLDEGKCHWINEVLTNAWMHSTTRPTLGFYDDSFTIVHEPVTNHGSI
jgi:hypothetical protein